MREVDVVTAAGDDVEPGLLSSASQHERVAPDVLQRNVDERTAALVGVGAHLFDRQVHVAEQDVVAHAVDVNPYAVQVLKSHRFLGAVVE